jgi:DNA-binding Lrp family transcriptional regulator
MDEKTRKILTELQDGFKLESRPFKRIATEVGYTEEEVISTIKEACEAGIIRRIGLAVRPEKIGYTENALVVWQVKDEQMEEVGTAISQYKEITHCYERECPPDWPYNLFTMMHASSKEQLSELIEEIKNNFGLTNYKIYKTQKEYKKSTMRYFNE